MTMTLKAVCVQSRRALLVAGASAAVGGLLGAQDVMAQVPAGLVEPHMRLNLPRGAPHTVALTFDLCPGSFDPRIAQALIATRTPATLFVSAAWIARNPEAVALLAEHRDLFSFQNHGGRHRPCILGERPLWGQKPVRDAQGVREEIDGGAKAVTEAFGAPPTWFRGATALYSPALLDVAQAEAQIGAFSLNGDQGATLSEREAQARISAAPSGSVIIAHLNQPRRAAGLGVARGVRALRGAGVGFVRLDALNPDQLIRS